MEIPQLFKESRYGIPMADQILPNRNYLIGYSYLFRQPRWAVQVIDGQDESVTVDREDAFRADLRVPEMFRSTLSDYRGSGYDRGHLVPSADRLSSRLENSETFLMTNMAPQTPHLNRVIWRELESKIRKVADKKNIVEVYVISGPVFDISKPLKLIGDDVVIPHEFFKSILVEDNRGKFKFFSYILPNDKDDEVLMDSLGDFATSTEDIEFRTGLQLWGKLKGSSVEREKKKVRRTLT
jgi:endonuclease G